MLVYIWVLKKIVNGIIFDIMKVCINFMIIIFLFLFDRIVMKIKIFFLMKEEWNKKKIIKIREIF